MHQCPREIQEVFLYTLYTVTHTKMERVVNTFEKVQSFGAAQDLALFHSRNPPGVPSTAVQIIWVQAMLLMLLDADARGPDNLLNRDGVPKHVLLQTVSKPAYDLAKSFGQVQDERLVTAPEPDADANIIRRCWMSLIILSRWYTISMGDPSLMKFERITSHGDGKILGRSHLAITCMSTRTSR